MNEILDGNIGIEMEKNGSVVFCLRAVGYESEKVRIPKEAAQAMSEFFKEYKEADD